MTEDMKSDPVEEAVRQWSDRYADGSAFRVMTSLVRAYSAGIRGVESVLREFDLNLSRYEVLLLLSFTRRGSLPMGRLRDLLMVHGSSVTYLVRRLEGAGLVERRRGEEDGRVILVSITSEGQEIVERASTRLVEAGFGPISGYEEDERDELSRLLARLRGDGAATAAGRGEAGLSGPGPRPEAPGRPPRR